VFFIAATAGHQAHNPNNYQRFCNQRYVHHLAPA
jgi:hypothetical protein